MRCCRTARIVARPSLSRVERLIFSAHRSLQQMLTERASSTGQSRTCSGHRSVSLSPLFPCQPRLSFDAAGKAGERASEAEKSNLIKHKHSISFDWHASRQTRLPPRPFPLDLRKKSFEIPHNVTAKVTVTVTDSQSETVRNRNRKILTAQAKKDKVLCNDKNDKFPFLFSFPFPFSCFFVFLLSVTSSPLPPIAR